MPSLNKVILAGNLTRDPEVRYTPGGSAVADLGMAVSDSYRNKAGELVEQTCFVDVVVWGRQAETTAEYMTKGSPVLIEGRLQLDQWESPQGEKRSKLRVKADRVQFLGGGRRSEGGGGGGGGAGGGGHEGPGSSSSGAARSRPPADDFVEDRGDDSDDLPF